MVGDVKDHGTRKDLVNEWEPKVAEAAAHVAKTKGVLHGHLSAFVFQRCTDVNIVVDSDLNMNNVR